MLKFSIIIPVYNVAPYLRECLDSVLKQTFTDWEAICVDDGSTDGSGAILDEYAAKDKRFRVIHQANAGVSAARNAALDIMNGEWVGFLDADDVYRFNTLEVCRGAIDFSPRVDCVRFMMREFNDGTHCNWPEAEEQIEYRLLEFANKISLNAYNGGFGERVYRASKIRDIKFLPFCMGEDRTWLVEVLDRTLTMTSVNRYCYGYRQRSTSVMHQGVSVRIVDSEIRYASEVLKIMTYSKKEYPKYLFRVFSNFEVEHIGHSLLSLSQSEFKILKQLWKEKLLELSKYKKISLFQRVRMKALGVLCCRSVALLFAVFPYWLKRRGVNGDGV